jgi:hypothetical protein
VEARSVDGHLEERYQARQGDAWITVATSAGESEGPDPGPRARESSVGSRPTS